MLGRQGFTLMEILVVLIIIAVVAVFTFPNFTIPTEQARAGSAQNNLLAIYSAQQNYRNNNGSFVTLASLASINSTFSLNIQDDGTYTYSCSSAGPTCTATRTNSPPNLVIQVTLNKAIQLTGESNPTCTSTSGNSNWCP